MKASYMIAIAIALMGCALTSATTPTTPYLLQLKPGFTDGVSSISLAKSELFDWQVAVATLGPCAARIQHYHADANELLYVTAGSIVYVNVEANNTFTRGEAGPGYLVEQPQGVFHVVYNPTCGNSTYTIFYNKATHTTYNVPYAIERSGNFTLDATWYPRPQLRYPASNDKGLWSYNPECLQKCNYKLPSNLEDIQTRQPVQSSG